MTIPMYEPHPGTVKISGGTDCRKAAKCALFFLQRNVGHIDFFYIGANAGQQAMKAMGIMRNFLEEATDGKSTVLFQPNRVQTKVADYDNPTNVTVKDAVYWRAYVIRADSLETILRQYAPEKPLEIPASADDSARMG